MRRPCLLLRAGLSLLPALLVLGADGAPVPRWKSVVYADGNSLKVNGSLLQDASPTAETSGGVLAITSKIAFLGGHMKRILVVGALVVIGLAPSRAPAGEFSIVRDGQPKAVIVVEQKQSKTAVAAAGDLQRYVQRISGATLPILFGEGPEDGQVIFVGDGPTVQQLAGSLLTQERLGSDGYILQTSYWSYESARTAGPDRLVVASVTFAACQIRRFFNWRSRARARRSPAARGATRSVRTTLRYGCGVSATSAERWTVGTATCMCGCSAS